MVTGTLDLHIMDQQSLAKVSFKKKKKKEEIAHTEEHITAYPSSRSDLDVFNTYFETLKCLNSHYRLTAR